MAVNENVYGAANTWYDSDFQQANLPDKNKTACFDSTQGVPWSTLGLGVDAGKLSWSEPIDKSLSFCGLGIESALSTVCYYDNSGQIIDVNERSITNFAFFEKSNDVVIYSDNTFFDTNHMDYLTWQDGNNFTRTNYSRQLKPLTRVNPKNVVLSLYVIATNNNITASVNVTLKQYLENYTTSYPLIHNVYYKYWYGNVSEIGRRDNLPFAYLDYRRPLLISILDTYDIPSKNLSFNAYDINNPAIFGNVSTSPYIGTNDTTSWRMIYCTPTARDHIVFKNVNNLIYGLIEYYPEFETDILKSVACFGLYFTPNDSICETGALTNNDMYIGILDADGVGHGKYLRGAETANAPQNNWSDMTQSGYDYEKNVDKTKYRNDTQFYAGYGTSSFTKFYALTEAQVNQLSQELYRIANDVPSGTSITEYNMKMFLTNNPIDCIISLKKFPVENIPLASSDATIYLGAKATNITGKILVTPTWVYYFNFKNSEDQSCRPIFGDNFLDYEPYTKCKIVIPFCGTVDVPVSYIYQYDDLKIALVMDFITGAATAYIMVNGITIDSITGSCAIDLPVSGIQSATLDSQIHSVAMAREKQQTTLGTGLIAGAVSIGIGLATGSLPVAIGGGAAIIGSFMHASDTGKQINYDLSHMETPVKQVTAASGQIAHTYDMRCKMVITRPEIAAEYSAEEYAQTIGFACLENGTVQQFHGLTVANIDLSGINCTAQEKEMIRSAFSNGVYLPAEYSDTYWNEL